MHIIMITGKVNAGKTSLMRELVKKEKKAGFSPAGILAPGVFQAGVKTGYDVKSVASGKRARLARRDPGGKFIFYRKGFELARKALLPSAGRAVMFLDEAGPLELAGKGHAGCLYALLDSDLKRLYLSVRDSCVRQVKKKFLRGKGHRITVMKAGGTA